jgi:NADH-quinone oxidoreductase subunit K
VTLTLAHFLTLGAILFAIAVVGIFMNRKNLIVFSHYLGDASGQIFVFFILTVAAAESAIGLAILVVLFRNLDTINVEELDRLKG